jgi:hypothetical protein
MEATQVAEGNMVHLQLSDVTAAVLSARAAAQGLLLEAYLDQMAQSAPTPSVLRLSFDEFERLLDEGATTGPVPTGTFPRTELYSDHD